MPNWCNTDYVISRSKENGGVKPLYDLLEKWNREGTEIENSWNNNWLGVFVEKGLGVDPVNGPYSCRGCIIYLDMPDEEEIQLTAETAWSPMNEMWFDLAKKYLPGSEVIYTAIEPGNCIYETSDPMYQGRYCIDSWESGIECEWEAVEETVRETAAKLYGLHPTDAIKEYIGKSAVSEEDVKSFFKDAPVDKVIELVNDIDCNVLINPWNFVG